MNQIDCSIGQGTDQGLRCVCILCFSILCFSNGSRILCLSCLLFLLFGVFLQICAKSLTCDVAWIFPLFFFFLSYSTRFSNSLNGLSALHFCQKFYPLFVFELIFVLQIFLSVVEMFYPFYVTFFLFCFCEFCVRAVLLFRFFAKFWGFLCDKLKIRSVNVWLVLCWI